MAHGMSGDARPWLATTPFNVMEYTLVNRSLTTDTRLLPRSVLYSPKPWQGISSFAHKIPLAFCIWTSLQSDLRHDLNRKHQRSVSTRLYGQGF